MIERAREGAMLELGRGNRAVLPNGAVQPRDVG